MKQKFLLLCCSLFMVTGAFAQNPNLNYNKFKQLHEEEQTPNSYRTASGAPGPDYFQQQADYKIEIELNEEEDRITGSETISYTNNSPDELPYLWVQLDQNVREQNADSKLSAPGSINPDAPKQSLKWLQRESMYDFDGGFNIEEVTTTNGRPLSHTIQKTMMRINLDQPLKPGEQYSFQIKWNYLINDRMSIGGRSGYEEFDDGNKLYTIAQFYPRMAVYNDYEGWVNKQFLGAGEFALPFGNFDVTLTVPADHIVGATGVLQNEKEMLCKEMRDKLEEARNSYYEPVIIFSEEEAIENEEKGTKKTKTWHYKAENVRDFAFATSRKFIWDAMAVKLSNGETTMAMSLYPKEGNPLWEEYSTRAVAHTIEVYSRYTFDYPYPVAYSVHAAAIGMEYPMICFNFGRPNEDGTYSDNTKWNMLGVIIHEVGHNYFPMIVNSNERQWGWMDEGLNSFVEYLAEKEFDPDFDHWFGPAEKILPYLKGDKSTMNPIMTDADNIYPYELGNNAYGKPAAALNILREYVMGPELFDYSFKTFAQRWKFKHPTPEDFFRTMEDASAVDLDWFWRGWFYTTDHVDVNLNNVYEVSLSDQSAQEEVLGNERLYQLQFTNDGGLPTPVILELEYADGSVEKTTYPAEVWRRGDKFNKVIKVDKELTKVTFDPENVLTDTNTSNNVWPKSATDNESKFDQFKNNQE